MPHNQIQARTPPYVAVAFQKFTCKLLFQGLMHFPPTQYWKVGLVPRPINLNRLLTHNIADSEPLWSPEQCPSGQRMVKSFHLPTQFQSSTSGCTECCLEKNAKVGLSRKVGSITNDVYPNGVRRKAPKPGICHLFSRPVENPDTEL